MTPTIKDIAKKAKVSLSTVSLVLNEKDNVSEKTRRKVLKAIKELSYHPRRSARAFASQKSGNIGFIVTDDHFSRAEPFYTKIFLGTEFEARKFNYYILLTTVEKTFDGENAIPRFLLEKNVDGVILAGKVPVTLIEFIQQRNLPIVLIDFFTRDRRVSAVLIDNIEGAYQAVNHLINQGHRRIAFIGGDMEHPSIEERFQGYRFALENAGLTLDDSLVVTDEPYTGDADGYNAICKLLQRKAVFTAVFAANDAMAIGAIRCLQKHNVRIPDDVALVGFDDIESDLQIEPHLTTMHVPKEEMGAIAIRRIVEMIKDRRTNPSKILIPVELVVRQSSRREKLGTN